MFPTPKYLRIRKRVNPEETKKPCRELANIIEKVKKRSKKIKRKKPKRAREVSGSIK